MTGKIPLIADKRMWHIFNLFRGLSGSCVAGCPQDNLRVSSAALCQLCQAWKCRLDSPPGRGCGTQHVCVERGSARSRHSGDDRQDPCDRRGSGGHAGVERVASRADPQPQAETAAFGRRHCARCSSSLLLSSLELSDTKVNEPQILNPRHRLPPSVAATVQGASILYYSQA